MVEVENTKRLAAAYREARAGYHAAREAFIAGLRARLQDHELARLAGEATKAFAASETAHRELLGSRPYVEA